MSVDNVMLARLVCPVLYNIILFVIFLLIVTLNWYIRCLRPLLFTLF